MALKITAITRNNPAPCQHWTVGVQRGAATKDFQFGDDDMEALLDDFSENVPGVEGLTRLQKIDVLVLLVHSFWQIKVKGVAKSTVIGRDLERLK